MGQQGSACAPHVGAAPDKGAGHPHRRWLARGSRQQAATEAHGHHGRIALVMFGLAAGEGWPREGVPADAGQALRGAEGRAPVPGEEAGPGDHQTVPRGRPSF